MTSLWPRSVRLSSVERESGLWAGADGAFGRHSHELRCVAAKGLAAAAGPVHSTPWGWLDPGSMADESAEPQQWQSAAGAASQHALGTLTSEHARAVPPAENVPAIARAATQRKFRRWRRLVMAIRG